MNRFEFGVILATVLLFTAISLIRAIVIPIVRRRATSYRNALTVPSQVEKGGQPLTGIHAPRNPDEERRIADSTAALDPLGRAPTVNLNEYGDEGGRS